MLSIKPRWYLIASITLLNSIYQKCPKQLNLNLGTATSVMGEWSLKGFSIKEKSVLKRKVTSGCSLAVINEGRLHTEELGCIQLLLPLLLP